jgi:hypothetical protein
MFTEMTSVIIEKAAKEWRLIIKLLKDEIKMQQTRLVSGYTSACAYKWPMSLCQWAG